MKACLAAALSIALIAACGVAPTDIGGRHLTEADAGPPPMSPLEAMQQALRPRLKDPDTALVKMLGSPKAMVTRGVLGLTNGGAGWRLCAEVNAKNSYGGYVGYKRIFVLWNSGQVIEYLDDDFGERACKGVEN